MPSTESDTLDDEVPSEGSFLFFFNIGTACFVDVRYAGVAVETESYPYRNSPPEGRSLACNILLLCLVFICLLCSACISASRRQRHRDFRGR